MTTGRHDALLVSYQALFRSDRKAFRQLATSMFGEDVVDETTIKRFSREMFKRHPGTSNSVDPNRCVGLIEAMRAEDLDGFLSERSVIRASDCASTLKAFLRGALANIEAPIRALIGALPENLRCHVANYGLDYATRRRAMLQTRGPDMLALSALLDRLFVDLPVAVSAPGGGAPMATEQPRGA
ncbi:hypothetical protein [Falsiroseomonas sp. E2-1-a20]|uniref:hypothetical protein n=1 Tax=Falsiroseomonas sp. E2-1-a20 TaxID=3239300 RepID=UPI003F369B3C